MKWNFLLLPLFYSLHLGANPSAELFKQCEEIVLDTQLFIGQDTAKGFLKNPPPAEIIFAQYQKINYREKMRKLVIDLSNYARKKNPQFTVIVNNAEHLILDKKGWATEYLNSIDGLGRESVFFGAEFPQKDYQLSPIDYTNRVLPFLRALKQQNKEVLVFNYVNTSPNQIIASKKNLTEGFLSFNTLRELNHLPGYPVENINRLEVKSLHQAKNFFYLLSLADDEYETKIPTRKEFLKKIAQMPHDILIIDSQFPEGKDHFLTKTELDQLTTKPQGGKRLMISYMSIGEAEPYRHYWEKNWHAFNAEKKIPAYPSFLKEKNPHWEGYVVSYWHPQWKKILKDYLKNIMQRGFNGVYLDLVDVYEYFEREHFIQYWKKKARSNL